MTITGATWASKALFLCGFVLVLAVFAATRAEAQRFDPHFPFGSTDINGTAMIGIVPEQTVRFNAVNIGVPANTCQVELTFLDAAGHVLTQSTHTLTPGTAALLDFTPPLDTSPRRMQVRAVGKLIEEGRTSCAILQSLEVFDNITLRTDFVLNGDPTW